MSASATVWQTARFRIDLSRPRVMGIVNATPDSFSDGGRYRDADAARAHCDALVEQGVDILDIGGESTRPGSVAPGVDEELARVLPVVRHAVTLGVPVSVDTSSPEVMRAVLAAGADIVNDVRSLLRPGALEAVAAHPTAGVCVMHMRGEPATMQSLTDYDDVVAEVAGFLRERAAALEAAGIARERIAADPGVGFAKTAAHNLELLARQRELLDLQMPLLVGWSRKGTLGQLTGRPAGERLAASVAAALMAVERGARIVRVHDVGATVDALKVWSAVACCRRPAA
ncbi:dihydropteroate synthase [Rubrivivax benzoatilyticus]|uniref:Dihydropteroate synthase n=1 Tax=Rubrivivax benzoatilyticus TaxID=316997 RepID=A0ABX0I0E8_9BURK|nr:dihydropteroate synthase [Rubrivivax benzoatilyticus]EGJ10589.1 dihydropteroate synthase [Rubrivivax benzoatilyticus JA2 = ATCC BAA-35]NHK99045.1 dihydropteroate synthase [Rubrivivax benzoatilyticus]NHL25092.1 dihydropteroate synthase [Rubrivivax benzoatilyticus]